MVGVSHSVGIKIRNLRKQKGMTLSNLARLCRCSSSLLSQIERGIVNPSFSTLKSIGESLDISLAQLVMEASTIENFSSSLMTSKERKVLTAEGGGQVQLLSRNVPVT